MVVSMPDLRQRIASERRSKLKMIISIVIYGLAAQCTWQASQGRAACYKSFQWPYVRVSSCACGTKPHGFRRSETTNRVPLHWKLYTMCPVCPCVLIGAFGHVPLALWVSGVTNCKRQSKLMAFFQPGDSLSSGILSFCLSFSKFPAEKGAFIALQLFNMHGRGFCFVGSFVYGAWLAKTISMTRDQKIGFRLTCRAKHVSQVIGLR